MKKDSKVTLSSRGFYLMSSTARTFKSTHQKLTLKKGFSLTLFRQNQVFHDIIE